MKCGTSPHRRASRRRSPVSGCRRTTMAPWNGATFQLAARLGRSPEVVNRRQISSAESREAKPLHIVRGCQAVAWGTRLEVCRPGRSGGPAAGYGGFCLHSPGDPPRFPLSPRRGRRSVNLDQRPMICCCLSCRVAIPVRCRLPFPPALAMNLHLTRIRRVALDRAEPQSRPAADLIINCMLHFNNQKILVKV